MDTPRKTKLYKQLAKDYNPKQANMQICRHIEGLESRIESLENKIAGLSENKSVSTKESRPSTPKESKVASTKDSKVATTSSGQSASAVGASHDTRETVAE